MMLFLKINNRWESKYAAFMSINDTTQLYAAHSIYILVITQLHQPKMKTVRFFYKRSSFLLEGIYIIN